MSNNMFTDDKNQDSENILEKLNTMKQPNECETIADVRAEIDRIDKEIIKLIGERFKYVKEIVRFKSTLDEVKAKQRYYEVLVKRRKWAEDAGLNADVIEKLYNDLMQHFIDEQMKLLRIKQE